MRTSRIFVADKLTSGSSVTLEGEAAHYLNRVLRLKLGDSFNPFNGIDGEFIAEITGQDRNQLTAHLHDSVINNADTTLVIHLGLGLSRGERMDYAIQKSTELGVSSITPLITARGEVKLSTERQSSKVQHWQKVAISASEQCGRNNVPDINAPSTLTDWVREHQGGLVLDHRGSGNIAEQPFENHINLLIGAEGGLSEEELEIARQYQYIAVKLGPRILRTETAPVVALTLLQYLSGDI